MSTAQPSTARSVWSSRIGFILASAGSAVGLGAIWKFPYMAGTNGGSVFMLPYIFFTLTIGLALLIGEMAMGRRARAAVPEMTQIFPENWMKTYYNWLDNIRARMTGAMS